MQRFNVVYGQITGKGGWKIKGMDIIEAVNEDVAYSKAEYIAHKLRENVLEVTPSVI